MDQQNGQINSQLARIVCTRREEAKQISMLLAVELALRGEMVRGQMFRNTAVVIIITTR